MRPKIGAMFNQIELLEESPEASLLRALYQRLTSAAAEGAA